MKLFDKLKYVLFEDEEVDVPVITDEKEEKEPPKNNMDELKKELFDDVDSMEFELPKKKTSEEVNEKEVYKSEPTFSFPLAFDDEEPIKTRSDRVDKKETIKSEKKEEKRVDFGKYEMPEPKYKTKTFRPSPVISPVYGILDQNYKKEDIVDRNDTKLDLDEVRNKAYGVSDSERVNKDIEETEIAEEQDIKTKTIDELISNTSSIDFEEEEVIKENVSPKKAIDTYKALDKIEDEIKTVSERKEDNISDDTTETDLFELIDSMYEKKGKSED